MGGLRPDSDSGRVAGLEVGIVPVAQEGAVVEVIQGGEAEGAARGLAGKRKRREELAHQPVRHSLWEQGSLEANNEPDGPHGPDIETTLLCLGGPEWTEAGGSASNVNMMRYDSSYQLHG